MKKNSTDTVDNQEVIVNDLAPRFLYATLNSVDFDFVGKQFAFIKVFVISYYI